MKEKKNLVDYLSTDRIAAKTLGFGRGKAFFYGRILEIDPSKKYCSIVLSDFSNRRPNSRFEMTSVAKKAFLVPHTVRVWRMPRVVGLAFMFTPWEGQGVFRACICESVMLELAMKYCRIE